MSVGRRHKLISSLNWQKIVCLKIRARLLWKIFVRVLTGRSFSNQLANTGLINENKIQHNECDTYVPLKNHYKLTYFIVLCVCVTLRSYQQICILFPSLKSSSWNRWNFWFLWRKFSLLYKQRLITLTETLVYIPECIFSRKYIPETKVKRNAVPVNNSLSENVIDSYINDKDVKCLNFMDLDFSELLRKTSLLLRCFKFFNWPLLRYTITFTYLLVPVCSCETFIWSLFQKHVCQLTSTTLAVKKPSRQKYWLVLGQNPSWISLVEYARVYWVTFCESHFKCFVQTTLAAETSLAFTFVCIS